jgi:hypothetical protein
MSDADAVHAQLRAFAEENERLPLPERQEIPDGLARIIASWWCNGTNTESVAFVSTGAVPKDSTELWRALVPDYNQLAAVDRLAVDYLGTYLLHHSGRRRVPGWNTLWIELTGSEVQTP